MTIDKETTGRTEHLLALMTRGDDLFNARDWQALDDVHHPEPERAEPAQAERQRRVLARVDQHLAAAGRRQARIDALVVRGVLGQRRPPGQADHGAAMWTRPAGPGDQPLLPGSGTQPTAGGPAATTAVQPTG